jgi:hypothetical protein
LTEFDDFLEEAKQKTSAFIEDLILNLIKQLDYDRVVKQDQTCRKMISEECKVDDPVVTLEDSHDMQRKAEIFYSPLVQSIREPSANIEKISDFEWEDIENQDPGDVF